MDFELFYDDNQRVFECVTISHQVELDKVKEMHAAAEKLRRERWIEEKTKKIKVGSIASSV